MINNKKKITKIKMENFLNEFPILILLQHNNFTVNDWLTFRKKIQEITTNKNSDSLPNFRKNGKESNTKKSQTVPQLEILNVKNSLLKKILLNPDFFKISNSSPNTLNFICQGPNFLIGCKDDSHLNFIWNSINSNSKLIFITCIYRNQLLNHLDLQTLLKTNSSIYSDFIHNLDKKTNLYNTLQQSFKLSPLFLVQYNFLNTLSLVKYSLIDK